MFLAIDQGNSRTKFGLFHGEDLQESWSIPTEKQATAAELTANIICATPADRLPGRWGLCSVVPEQEDSWRDAAMASGATLTVLNSNHPTALRNAYATPDTLGTDRLMAAVAAARLVGLPVIPISLGTATVVDAVTADATYLGGMIAPGIGTSMSALAGAASALNQIDWPEAPTPAIGRSSHDAMVNGLFYQQTGGLRAMVQAIRRELAIEAPLALTGGWSKQLAPYLEGVALVDEHLVLRGIAFTLQRPPQKKPES